MTANLRSWWEKIKTQRVVIVIVAIVLAVIVALIIRGYQLGWTGFKGKALWDWLNLLGVLAIPAVVGLGTAWFTKKQGEVSDAASKQQHETDLQVATDNQRETALQAYIDKISEEEPIFVKLISEEPA